MNETTPATFKLDIQGEEPVLVDFWAPWCEPCLALAPHLEQLAADYAGQLRILKLNIDDAPEGWKQFGVRAIPTLVFYRDGEEHSRLTGPSIMRLRLMVKKWLMDLGISQPQATGESALQPDALDGTVTTTTWCSFNGDAAVKATAMERLRRNQTSKEYVPSECLAGELPFETIVGVPWLLGDLLDALYWTQSGYDTQMTFAPQTQILELVETMPVGADLSMVSVSVLYDLIYVSPWAITQYFPAGSRWAELVARIGALHARDHAREEIVPVAAWEVLQREAILLAEMGLDEDVSEILEALARPLCDNGAVSVVDMLTHFFSTDYRRYPDWSEAEARLIEAMQEADDEQIREALGEPPDGEGPAEEVWFADV